MRPENLGRVERAIHDALNAITDEMIEAGANALADRQGSWDGYPSEIQYQDAEVVLRAALGVALNATAPHPKARR